MCSEDETRWAGWDRTLCFTLAVRQLAFTHSENHIWASDRLFRAERLNCCSCYWLRNLKKGCRAELYKSDLRTWPVGAVWKHRVVKKLETYCSFHEDIFRKLTWETWDLCEWSCAGVGSSCHWQCRMPSPPAAWGSLSSLPSAPRTAGLGHSTPWWCSSTVPECTHPYVGQTRQIKLMSVNYSH